MANPTLKFLLDPEPTGTGAANIYVEAKIKDQSYQMTLDTGAAKSSIQNDAVTASFKVVGKTSSESVFTDKTTDDLVTIPEFKLGRVVLHDFVASRARIKNQSINLLGLNFFGDLKMTFRFSKRQLEILKSVTNTPDCQLQSFETSPNGHVLLPIKFADGTKALALWDTGMSMTLVDDKFYKSHAKLFQPIDGSVDMSDAKNNLARMTLLRMPSITVGDAGCITESTVSAMDLTRINHKSGHHVDLVMGYSTLGLSDWTIDFPNKKYCLRPKE